MIDWVGRIAMREELETRTSRREFLIRGQILHFLKKASEEMPRKGERDVAAFRSPPMILRRPSDLFISA